jgi:hypothetical protein
MTLSIINLIVTLNFKYIQQNDNQHNNFQQNNIQHNVTQHSNSQIRLGSVFG